MTSADPTAAPTACGHCGYRVRGLSTFVCPECGSDLREVGIVRPRPRSLPLVWKLVFWAATCIGLFTVTTVIVRFTARAWLHQNENGYFLAWWMTALAALAWIVGRHLWVRGVGFGRAAPGVPRAVESQAAAFNAGPARAVNRTLTVMFVDVEGYTAYAASASREDLMALLRRTRDLVRPAVERRGGRLVKTVGDGFLVTFDSPTNAVLAGREVLAAVAADPGAAGRSTGDPGRLGLRVGVATGEVTLEDGDVFGNAVNLASRVQQLATGGQAYFDESTYHAMNRSEVPHAEVGVFDLKGVPAAVRVYKALDENPR
jgi:class 3 adenylate cyclase